MTKTQDFARYGRNLAAGMLALAATSCHHGKKRDITEYNLVSLELAENGDAKTLNIVGVDQTAEHDTIREKLNVINPVAVDDKHIPQLTENSDGYVDLAYEPNALDGHCLESIDVKENDGDKIARTTQRYRVNQHTMTLDTTLLTTFNTHSKKYPQQTGGLFYKK